MRMRKLLDTLKYTLLGFDSARPLASRVRELRDLATQMPDPAAPSPHAAPPGSAAVVPDSGQADYVAMLGWSTESPERIFSRGAELIHEHTDALSRRHQLGVMAAGHRQLDALERKGILRFDEYALLRDLLAIAPEGARAASDEITPGTALDFALAVRCAQRLLGHHLANAPSETDTQEA